MIVAALERNPLFITAALPLRVFPPLFNRYEGGETFGAHLDNSIMQIPGTPYRIRTDISATLFLSKPEEYDGGELVIDDVYGSHAAKLPAGDMVVYPATSLHHVNPVTRGVRLASFFWVQSMVRDDGQRTLLFDLDHGDQSGQSSFAQPSRGSEPDELLSQFAAALRGGVRMKLHKIIFWSHLLAGTIAALVIFLMSFTGVLLMYAPQILAFAERQVRQVSPPTSDAKQLSLDEVITKARETNPEIRLTGLMLRSDPTAAVSIGFGREGVLYIDPYTGRVLGQGSKLRDWLHAVEDWHRWLGMEGENRAIGKGISGACNLAFFWLAVTGVYLWWPRSWKWRGLKTSLVFNPHLRGKARDWNWHNVIGFWSSTVLIILTLTAAVMSYNWANDLLYTLTGNEPPRRIEGPANIVQRTRGRGAGQKRSRIPESPRPVSMLY